MRICDKSYFVNPYSAQAHQSCTRIRVFAARRIHRREHHTLEWRMSMTVPPIRKAGTPISVIATEAVLAAALIFAGGLFAGCGNNVNASSAGPRPAMKVAVVKAEQSDVPLSGEWVGTLDGFVNAQIQPQANGYLILQNYREGSQVEKGQVLFEIDPRPFAAALQQAQGQLGQAQAQLSLAQINVNRDTPLAAARAIARSQLDNDTQQKAQAEAAVRSAEAAVATANLNLGFTKVRSLITGVAGQATTRSEERRVGKECRSR